MIPDKKRTEWKQLVTGELSCQFSNFVLQMKIEKLRKDFSHHTVRMEHAIEQLHDLCCKYEVAVKQDLEKIFKQ